MKNRILITVIAIIIIAVALFAFFGRAHAWEGKPTPTPKCQKGFEKDEADCRPSPTPTPTPYHFACNEDHICAKTSGRGENSCDENKDCQPKVTPTPSIEPCMFEVDSDHPVTINLEDGHVHGGLPCPSVTPTVSPTPSTTPSVTPTPTPSTGGPGDGKSDGGSSSPGATQAPGAATCNIPFTKPWITSVVPVGNGTMDVDWGSSAQGITKFSLTYGPSENDQSMGEDGIPSDSRGVPVNLLKPGQSYIFHVWAWQGQCPEISDGFDPIAR